MSLADELLATINDDVAIHDHTVSDSDSYFIIDPDSREITNAAAVKNTVMQFDHMSEIYTFEVPRYVEGHDMTLCNRARVHFINVDGKTGEEHRDVAEMDDLRVDPEDENRVLSTWTIRREATQLAGNLSFAVQYMCVADDGEVVYEWHTDIYSDVDVKRSLNNSEAAVIEYTNILEEWYQKLFSSESSGVSDEQIAKAVSDYLTENPIEQVTEEELTAAIEAYFIDHPIENDTVTEEELAEAIGVYLAEHPIEGGENVGFVAQPEPPSDTSVLWIDTDDETNDSSDSSQNPTVASVEPAEDDIPDVHFIVKGGMPFTKDEGDVQVLMRYISKTATIERYCTAKVQGSSSASNATYKKRNWTIKVYKDSTYEKKEKLSFKGWPAMNKFVLKAGWVIPGHLRNVGAAKIWGQIMRSRSDYTSLPEELRNSPNQGATDGFHVRVFINGMYWGVYDWIVAKDQLFGQDKDNAAHSILNSELNNQPTCAFATTTPTINGNWSEELLDNMAVGTKTSMENWIKFVAGSTDAEFVANAENYFDVQSVIDAICFDRIIMPVDNMCRNQIVFKYDTKWYMGKWDLDAILGLPPVAEQTWYSYDTAYQEGYVAYKDYGIINMLYDRTEKLFLERFKENYWRLRSGPLSEANLVEVFGRLSDRLRSIEGLLAEENASTTGNGQFTGMPNVGKDTIQQIRETVVKRCAFMDEVVENMNYADAVPCTGISLNANALTFTAEGSQTLTATVTPDGCTDAITWESDNASVATVNGGVVTAIANGNATITARCGDYSASCSVAVSGIAQTVPCTGVTLDKSELTFNGDGTQTITATVAPTDTTDDVAWVSSNPAVASITVEGNVCTVQSVSNGDAVITVTCGNYRASCNVAVSGFVTVLYELASPTAFDGATRIDTGVAPYTEDADSTLAIDFVLATGNGQATHVYRCGEYRIADYAAKWMVFVGPEASNATYSLYGTEAGSGARIVVTRNANTKTWNVYGVDLNGNKFTDQTNSIGDGWSKTMDFLTTEDNLLLGATVDGYYFKGTINRFVLDKRVWSAEEISAYLNA